MKSKKTGADYWSAKEYGSETKYWNRQSNYLAYWDDAQAVQGWGWTGGDNGSALLFTEPVMMDFSTFSTEDAPKWFSVQFATGGNFLSGVATDEYDTDVQIDTLAKTLTFALETGHTVPQNFWGVGGTKIFRDLIYQMRGMMKADHKFYKKQGIYDFPQKNQGKTMLMYAVGALLSSEKILSKMGNKMNEGMLMPYEQILKKMDK